MCGIKVFVIGALALSVLAQPRKVLLRVNSGAPAWVTSNSHVAPQEAVPIDWSVGQVRTNAYGRQVYKLAGPEMIVPGTPAWDSGTAYSNVNTVVSFGGYMWHPADGGAAVGQSPATHPEKWLKAGFLHHYSDRSPLNRTSRWLIATQNPGGSQFLFAIPPLTGNVTVGSPIPLPEPPGLSGFGGNTYYWWDPTHDNRLYLSSRNAQTDLSHWRLWAFECSSACTGTLANWSWQMVKDFSTIVDPNNAAFDSLLSPGSPCATGTRCPAVAFLALYQCDGDRFLISLRASSKFEYAAVFWNKNTDVTKVLYTDTNRSFTGASPAWTGGRFYQYNGPSTTRDFVAHLGQFEQTVPEASGQLGALSYRLPWPSGSSSNMNGGVSMTGSTGSIGHNAVLDGSFVTYFDAGTSSGLQGNGNPDWLYALRKFDMSAAAPSVAGDPFPSVDVAYRKISDGGGGVHCGSFPVIAGGNKVACYWYAETAAVNLSAPMANEIVLHSGAAATVSPFNRGEVLRIGQGWTGVFGYARSFSTYAQQGHPAVTWAGVVLDSCLSWSDCGEGTSILLYVVAPGEW